MTRAVIVLSLLAQAVVVLAAPVPRAPEQATIVLPDYGAEVRAFNDTEKEPVSWWPHVVNAGWGDGAGGPERNGGWIAENWMLLDCLDRSADYTTHEWLKHRGIWYEVYGSNEYQETIHFHEEGARRLFWDNGIARDAAGERVMSQHYNMSVPSWAERAGFNAFIVCNNAPRWSAVINYDWLTSPLLGFGISQDNIGGPTSRIGAGGHGRYCDACNARFRHYLATTGRLPDFRAKYGHIRDYAKAELQSVFDQLPPKVPYRFDPGEAALLAKLCAPPVMSEYQKFLYLSQLRNFLRYRRDAKLVAARMGHEWDAHGNQGGGFIGPDAYQVVLSDLTDTVWFETSGMSAYDMFKNHWNNAWGSFSLQMGWAMTGGRKPFMRMTHFHKHTPDLVEHEMAEVCAGGGVLFVGQRSFAKEPELQRKMEDYFRFRHEHRALFSFAGKARHAEIALAYSVPTMMYRAYQYSADTPPNNATSGMARALEEGHLPFDVLIFHHPEIRPDRVALETLKRYRLLIVPALECLSEAQVGLFTRYLKAGGALGIVGPCGARDENNVARRRSPLEAWRKAGRVVDLLPGRMFRQPRVQESEETQEITRLAIGRVRAALDGSTLLTGDLPRLLWVKTWRHGQDLLSLHFVNYDVDFESGAAAPTQPAPLTVALPPGLPAEEAAWLAPGEAPQPVPMTVEVGRARVTIPAVRVYGVLAIGRAGLDAKRSALLQGDALLARAKMASGEAWQSLEASLAAAREARERCARAGSSAAEAAAYAEAAGALLRAVPAREDAAYLEGLRRAADPAGSLVALDFGAAEAQAPWKAVGPDATYSTQRGFGWLPPDDNSEPTPEERWYAMAHRYGGTIATDLTTARLFAWPYREPAPGPLRSNLACGTPRRFRVDVPPDAYTVRVVTTNPSWCVRNFLVSGMVAANGAVRLLDVPMDRGAFVSREFGVAAPEGRIDLTFGGPTGWAVAALLVKPGAGPEDPQVAGGLRQWRISPRYANPDWHPIGETRCPPETRLNRLPDPGWTPVEAPAAGIPVVDLGANTEAEVGDTLYATTTLRSPAARTATLRFTASSQAQLWLNGAPVAYVPNEKGLRRDELAVPVRLRAGENRLVVKLQRFWERRWLFAASVTG